ncbi:guanine nucleotide binding protein, alpha subunit [Mycena galericulata]|nr:guanine nucleotide binding protein, alpha subunit [Mycena galericulata]
MLRDNKSTKATLMRHINILYGGLTDKERREFTASIHSTALAVTREFSALLTGTILLPLNLIACRQTILDHILQGHHTLGQELARAIHTLWTNDDVRETASSLLDRSAIQFLDRILHIGSPDYIPTDNDILRCKMHAPPPMEEISVKLDDRWTCSLVCPRQPLPSKHKWLSSIDGISSLLFVLNLDHYDRPEHMRDAVALFDYICTSPQFERTCIHLVMNQSGSFIQKLATSPLSTVFPDYSDGNNFQRAVRYLLYRFMSLRQGHPGVYPSFVDVMDADMVRATMNMIINIYEPRL